MKTKHYELTEVEMMAIRNALDFHWHGELKKLKPISPLPLKVKKSARVLLDQFKQDVSVI